MKYKRFKLKRHDRTQKWSHWLRKRPGQKLRSQRAWSR